jgi:DNA-3-methyladenine glycosylase I
MELQRCFGDGDDLMAAYHDQEWGVPQHGDQALFQKLMLDAFQAGLSWRIILHKRPAFLEAFDDFQPERVARFTPARIEALMANPGIVRSRRKIEATVTNARACLQLQDKEGSLDKYLWSFTGGVALKGPPVESLRDVPSRSPESEAMSKGLRGWGFKFVGPTVCYAFMQAVGMVDDHVVTCFKYRPPI